MASRPKREKKGDRLIHPGVSATDIRVDYALAGFDRMAEQMDRKWGVDRLVELVPPEMAERYGSAMAKLNAAINAADPEQVAARAAVCMRGMEAMDRAASESGATPASDEVWVVQADGRQYGLLRDDRGWQRAQQKHPHLVLLTEREMVMALERFVQSRLGETVVAVKEAFPGAAVSGVREDDGEMNGDIPW